MKVNANGVHCHRFYFRWNKNESFYNKTKYGTKKCSLFIFKTKSAIKSHDTFLRIELHRSCRIPYYMYLKSQFISRVPF